MLSFIDAKGSILHKWQIVKGSGEGGVQFAALYDVNVQHLERFPPLNQGPRLHALGSANDAAKKAMPVEIAGWKATNQQWGSPLSTDLADMAIH